MISIETLKKPSIKLLMEKNHADGMRVLHLYDQWDVAARNKDFHEAYHIMFKLKKIHRENGIEES